MANLEYTHEFRSIKDDAWYTCAILLQTNNNNNNNHHLLQLRVKLKDFDDPVYDEIFSVADFSSHEKLHQFLARFRSVSVPVENHECSRVVAGTNVCAVYKGHVAEEEVLYYDALVDDVRPKEHTPEKCSCTFLLFWQHGPGEGNITATSIEDICFIVDDGAVDPKVTEFANLVKRKLKTSPDKSQVYGCVVQSSRSDVSAVVERSFHELSDHDMDLGGVNTTERHHYIIVENLEKKLCPLYLMDFINQRTTIMAQTFIFPSLEAETCTRGAIVVNSSAELKKIYDFINHPNHLITSSSGRPWVIADDKLKTGTFNPNQLSMHPKYEKYGANNELKVVRLGTEEYRKSKQLKDLYLEFRNHVSKLVQRLAVEEQKRDLFSICKL